jgi:ABC-type multidrug transport system ATPase subunit
VTRARERNDRVDEVMGELALTRHATTRAGRLSGGQLKRVNVLLPAGKDRDCRTGTRWH